MSLILRKQCQPLLNKAKLDKYHATLSKTKHLQIVCGCGEPLLTLSDIQFTRTSPSRAEIEYAVELLRVFLTNMQKDITKLVELKQKYDDRPKLDSVKLTALTKKEAISLSVEGEECKYTPENSIYSRVNVNTRTKSVEVCFPYYSGGPYEYSQTLKKATLDTRVIVQDVIKLGKLIKADNVLRDAYQDAFNSINSCTISYV